MEALAENKQATFEMFATSNAAAPEEMTRVIARGMVEDWNDQYVPGHPVSVTYKSTARNSFTASKAFVWGGKPGIWIQGIPGFMPLGNVTPLETSEADAEPKGRSIVLAEYIKRTKSSKESESIKGLKVKMGIGAKKATV